MSNFFDVNFDKLTNDLIPPDKRLEPNITIIRSCLKAIQWCRDLVLGSYKSGAIAPNWSAGFYNKYDQVIYKKAVYYSLIDNNTDIPDIQTSWIQIQKDFIGTDERVKFNGQKIVLEYALNKRFGGVFRPPSSLSNSDIYITNVGLTPFGFRVGQTIGSSVGLTHSSDNIGSKLPFIRINNFQINFLSSIYSLTNEKEVRGFADKYVFAGLNYIVVPY